MDQELLKACKKGDRLAQKKLYEQFYGRMMGVCLRYAANQNEAAEILNKGFLKVFNSLSKYDKAAGRFDSWVYKVMVNTAIDHYRAEIRHTHNVVEIEQAYYVGDETDALQQMSAQEIIDLVQKLTPGYRAVFNLYVIEGFTHQEIADELNIAVGTAKSNLAKARKKLQAMITKNNKVNITSYAR